MNYTFGKALGIVSASLDQFNLDNNYAKQPTNRKHIVNAAYSYDFRRLARSKFAGGFVIGWQFSGIAQYQSGANLTGQRTQTFGMALNSAKIPGTTYNISATSLQGTPNMTLSPVLTCDPRSNLGPNQVHQSELLHVPESYRTERSDHLPAIYGPAYFISDLGLFKNFQITESKN